jgi:hypothetical protein
MSNIIFLSRNYDKYKQLLVYCRCPEEQLPVAHCAGAETDIEVTNLQIKVPTVSVEEYKLDWYTLASRINAIE